MPCGPAEQQHLPAECRRGRGLADHHHGPRIQRGVGGGAGTAEGAGAGLSPSAHREHADRLPAAPELAGLWAGGERAHSSHFGVPRLWAAGLLSARSLVCIVFIVAATVSTLANSYIMRNVWPHSLLRPCAPR